MASLVKMLTDNGFVQSPYGSHSFKWTDGHTAVYLEPDEDGGHSVSTYRPYGTRVYYAGGLTAADATAFALSEAASAHVGSTGYDITSTRYDVMLYSTASDWPIIRRNLTFSESERLMALMIAYNGGNCAHWGITDRTVFAGTARTYRPIPTRI